MPTFEIEKEILKSYHVIAGVDEVGRGALAGPLVAAAVVFCTGSPVLYQDQKLPLGEDYNKLSIRLNGVDDSKKISAIKRGELDIVIRELASDISIGIVSVEEIDQMGVGEANILAFKRALDGLKRCDFALIDGRKLKSFSYQHTCFEKGESKSISIAAASIVAKVFRDSLMEELYCDFPDYNWKNNKGYGSKKHMDTIKSLGPTIHHRKSFLGFLGQELLSIVNKK